MLVTFDKKKIKYTIKMKRGRAFRKLYDACRLQISVGSNYHEDNKLMATLEWAKFNFKTVYICLNDTLQRYNLEFKGCGNTEATESCLRQGDLWIEKYQNILSDSECLKLYRWSEWLEDPSFRSLLTCTHDLYFRNPQFRKLSNAAIQALWIRKKNRNEVQDDDYDRFFAISKDYLMEETSVFLLMSWKNIAIDVYPSDSIYPVLQMRNTLASLQEKPVFIQPSEHFIEIGFGRNC